MLQHLVTRAGGDLTARAGDGMAPLHAAAQMGCLDCIKWMVKVTDILITNFNPGFIYNTLMDQEIMFFRESSVVCQRYYWKLCF